MKRTGWIVSLAMCVAACGSSDDSAPGPAGGGASANTGGSDDASTADGSRPGTGGGGAKDAGLADGFSGQGGASGGLADAADAAAPIPCEETPGTALVTQYGAFVADAPASADANTKTLHDAIADLGAKGGGTICLPAGKYFLGIDTGKNAAVVIDHDDITLWGHGPGSTILRTPSDWKLVNGAVFRGSGLFIQGTASLPARKAITLKQLELDGGAGFTGNFGWPADTTTGDGWDITHKGMILSADANVDEVTIEDVYVHSYRGEQIYVGGIGMGKLTVRRLKSDDTNASTFNVTANFTVEDSEFGHSRFWVEIGTIGTNMSGSFVNCRFHDAVADGIALTQGDGGTQPFVFQNDTFQSGPVGIAFYGGVGGPVTVQDNTFDGIGEVLRLGFAPGAKTSLNKDLTMTGNTVKNGGMLANLYGEAQNFVVKNNTFQTTTGTAVMYGASTLSGMTIESNQFTGGRTPEQSTTISGERPLFVGNTYTGCERRELQGVFHISTASPKVTPHFEEVQVYADTDGVAAVLETTQYPDGQRVTVTGGSLAARVKFPASSATVQCNADRYLAGSQTLVLEYGKAAGKWTEVSFQ